MARYLLEKQGHLYKFPSERTASIRIYSATQSFYDFGRGCGGDVIRLWSHVRGVDSWTALKQIRECFGLNTPDKAHSRDLIRKQEEARRQQIEAKKQEKAKEITEDELKGLEKEIQKVTDDAVKHVDEMTAHKEKELMEV